MKKKLLITVTFVTLLLLLFTTIASANDVTPVENTLVSTELGNTLISTDDNRTPSEKEAELEETLNVKFGDYFEMEKAITLSKSISGNAFLMGQDVTLNGCTIVGDVFVMGQNVTINGAQINGNLFVMGQNVKITGSKIFQLYAACADISVDSDSYVAVDTKIGSANIELCGQYGHNVDIVGDSIVIGEETVIEGKFEYEAQQEASIPKSASIAEYKFNKVDPEPAEEVTIAAIIMGKIKKCIRGFCAIVLLGLLVVFVGKKFEHTIMSSTIGESIGKGYLFWFISLLCILPLFVLMFTIVGTNAAVALLLTMLVLSLFASTAGLTQLVLIIFRKKIEDKKLTTKGIYGYLVLFGLAFTIIGLIPFLGGFVRIAVSALGYGSLIRSIFFRDKKEEKKKK